MQFVDFQSQFARIEKDVRANMERVLQHQKFILGDEVSQLEKSLSKFCGGAHVVSAASGSDALLMALLAWRIGTGDAVIVPAFTFVATAEVVHLLGARAVFTDVDARTFNIDADKLERTIARIKRENRYKLKAIIAVDLFGRCADYDAIIPIARAHDLKLLADAAQSFGATYNEKPVGAFGDITATSFFPTKPLGCYGDGGAVFTHDAALAEVLRSIRFHGRGAHQYDNIRVGITGRLDTLQAAVLNAKLKIFPDELAARRRIAATYAAELAAAVAAPPASADSSWAQYTIRHAHRDALQKSLHEQNIPSAVYYPRPLHQQPAFANADAHEDLSASEKLCREVLSLPAHPYLTESDQAQVIAAVKSAVK